MKFSVTVISSKGIKIAAFKTAPSLEVMKDLYDHIMSTEAYTTLEGKNGEVVFISAGFLTDAIVEIAPVLEESSIIQPITRLGS